ncbi:hypothetical protein [Deinococcus sp. AJ005]|uniref:hypothetical protein n=1 Tax=Deinococcus sp. AJ005 TaxID=2652443 RepID=UPI00125CC5E2|nr:hypothetical protein [Deinococcus sp. AJ005]QFP78612.1 hypothetical protein DAAJ005_18750 [Deinococcus sp. AJ005]
MKLSDLIAQMETKIQVKYIQQFREAAKGGEIDCMPIEKSFAVRGSMYRDLMTQQGETFSNWHQETLRQLELTTMRGAAGIAYEDDVTSGKIDFKSRAEEFRKSLKKKRKRTSKKLTPGEAVVDAGQASRQVPRAAAAAQAAEAEQGKAAD